jgi:hypothetical protein
VSLAIGSLLGYRPEVVIEHLLDGPRTRFWKGGEGQACFCSGVSARTWISPGHGLRHATAETRSAPHEEGELASLFYNRIQPAMPFEPSPGLIAPLEQV